MLHVGIGAATDASVHSGSGKLSLQRALACKAAAALLTYHAAQISRSGARCLSPMSCRPRPAAAALQPPPAAGPPAPSSAAARHSSRAVTAAGRRRQTTARRRRWCRMVPSRASARRPGASFGRWVLGGGGRKHSQPPDARPTEPARAPGHCGCLWLRPGHDPGLHDRRRRPGGVWVCWPGH